jgi:hypothetical protein
MMPSILGWMCIKHWSWEAVVETKAETILQFIRGLRGSLQGDLSIQRRTASNFLPNRCVVRLFLGVARRQRYFRAGPRPKPSKPEIECSFHLSFAPFIRSLHTILELRGWWNPPGANGGTSAFKICQASFSFSTTPPGCATNCTGISGTRTQIQSIVLPNKTACVWDGRMVVGGFFLREEVNEKVDAGESRALGIRPCKQGVHTNWYQSDGADTRAR